MSEQRSRSDILLDVACLFPRHLAAHVDRIRFAAVCLQWRTAARQATQLPPPLPLLALPDGTAYSLPRDKPFVFPGSANFTDACGKWLVFSSQDACVLRDPFSAATVTLPAPSRVRIQFLDQDQDQDRVETHEVSFLTVHKPILCSPDLAAAFVRFPFVPHTRIELCKPGASSSSSWTVCLQDPFIPEVVDIAFYKGTLYALEEQGFLLAMDISKDHADGDPWVSRTRPVIHGMHDDPGYWGGTGNNVVVKTRYLVESRGALLMVVREMYGVLKNPPSVEGGRHAIDADGRNEFEVFQADLERSRWTRVTTLGDGQVLFLRRRCCRSVHVSRAEMELPGDCIVFLENDGEDDCYLYSEDSYCSCSVYSMKHGSVSTLLPAVSWKRGKAFAAWLFP